MMKVVIHGTNGGYKSLNFLGTFNDVRPDNNKTACIGQKAYSIQYFESNVVFSKYLFIRDVVGDKRTGNVAFSLVIPQSKKLSGEYIVEILEKISVEFERRHISSDNLDSFREDWKFVEEVIRDYDSLIELNKEEEIFNSGTLESGYLYFNVNKSLEEYFQLPYQEEYTAFKQVFLIDSKYTEKDENPLNALRHDSNSNLTDRVNLNKYLLKYEPNTNYGNAFVNVTINGLRKKKVSLNEILEIEISEKYKEKKRITVAIEDSNYVKIDHKAKIVSVEIDKIELDDVLFHFEFKIQNENGEVLNENFDIYTFSTPRPNLTTNDNEKWIKKENSKLTVNEKILDHNHIFIQIKTKSASSFIKEIKKEDSGQIIDIKVRSYYKTKLIVKNEHKDVNFEDCKIIFGNKECDFNELIIEDPKEITRIQTLKIIHPKYDEYNVSNFYITEDEVKAIYLPDHKIKPNYRTKASEKSKATNNQSNGTQRKKKENETNDWIIIIGVFIISCAGMFGLFKLFNYLNRPDIEFVEQVNPPETQKDTTTNSKGQQPDTDTIKKGENQQLETDGNKPSNAGNGKTIKEDKKRKEEDKKRKEEDKKRKEEEDKKRKEENKEIIENNNSNTLENEFWQYVHMQEPKIGNFIKLSKKVNKDFKYYDYLQKVSKKSGFDKFKKIEEIERINARKITDIQF